MADESTHKRMTTGTATREGVTPPPRPPRPDLDRLVALLEKVPKDLRCGPEVGGVRIDGPVWPVLGDGNTVTAAIALSPLVAELLIAAPALLAYVRAVEGERDRLGRVIDETRDAIFAMIPGEDFSMDVEEHYQLLTETLLTRLYDKLLSVQAPTPKDAAADVEPSPVQGVGPAKPRRAKPTALEAAAVERVARAIAEAPYLPVSRDEQCRVLALAAIVALRAARGAG